ncbi:hypothetical protein CJ030_MR6G023774 [Morella rubra]|uniref:Uncharacterized protein n=1 Tax=Morella rubra TaxID=262757 RepID=A0A6A1V9N7_9ROSI|nr:hypothetical protein CJ030_MR6G023774 [Morella rubra]
MAEEMLETEYGWVTLEVVVEKGETSGAVPIPVAINSPLPILEISLAYPMAVDTSLASIDQATLYLMVISGGGAEDLAMPSFKGKEAVAVPLEVKHEQPIGVVELGKEKSVESALTEVVMAPER